MCENHAISAITVGVLLSMKLLASFDLYSLMTLRCASPSPSGCAFPDFSKSISTMSPVPSERPLLGKLPAGGLMAPRKAIESRIETRLLSDTSSVLEYLSNGK